MMATAVTQELLPLEGSTRAVWKHFDGKIIVEKKKRDRVNCKLCNKVMNYSGSTTNMRFHHRSVFNSLPNSSQTRSVQLDKHQCTLRQVISASQPKRTTNI